MRVLLENADRDMVLSTAIALLAKMADEHRAGYPELLAWGFLAVDGK